MHEHDLSSYSCTLTQRITRLKKLRDVRIKPPYNVHIKNCKRQQLFLGLLSICLGNSYQLIVKGNIHLMSE